MNKITFSVGINAETKIWADANGLKGEYGRILEDALNRIKNRGAPVGYLDASGN